MIRFTLRCAAEHEFEGWFRSGDAFEARIGEFPLTQPHALH